MWISSRKPLAGRYLAVDGLSILSSIAVALANAERCASAVNGIACSSSAGEVLRDPPVCVKHRRVVAAPEVPPDRRKACPCELAREVHADLARQRDVRPAILCDQRLG